MAKNTKQIALIQNRHGKLNELPKQLSTAEFGFADDTNQLFIGNDGHPTLKERLESNTLPYGNVEIFTEFSDHMRLIKYSPFMNGNRIYYPVGLQGSVRNPQISVGSTISLNGEVLTFNNEGGAIIPGGDREKTTQQGESNEPYDYLVLEYVWENGKDLDTDTRFLDTSSNLGNQALGFTYNEYGYNGPNDGEDFKSKQRGLPYGSNIGTSDIYWSGDITKSAPPVCKEYILINFRNVISDNNLSDTIKIQLSGSWYSDEHSNDVKLKLTAYKNGSMYINENKEIVNSGGRIVQIKDKDGNLCNSVEFNVENISDITHEYKTFGYITINKNTRTTVFSNVDPNSSQELPDAINLEEAVRQINNADVNVDAIIRDNCIELRTIEDDLVIDNSTALESLGLTSDSYPIVISSLPVTKRTLQEVLDDRYSIKSFDVLGDGKTNEEEKINNALIILYNYAKSDRKELFFPADTYIVNENPLLLMSNTHLKGEGIDRTIIKSFNNTTLLITADDNTVKAGDTSYCSNGNYPNNILLEDMTFDVTQANCRELLLLGHCKNVTIKNCKFKGGSSIVNVLFDSNLENIVFNNVIFESGNKAIVVNGKLDNMLITNCEFKDISNHTIELNGNDSLIKNVIIANNKFTNCSNDSEDKIIIKVNEYTKYVNVVKSLVDENVLNEENGFRVLNRFVNELELYEDDYNYCDSPIKSTDTNKFLRFNFYQDVYDYVQALFDKYGHLAFEIISSDTNEPITNYFKLELGKDSNNDVLSLNSTSQTGNVEINIGEYADMHLGKTTENYLEWQPNYPYNALDIVYYENKLYRCLEGHTSTGTFDPTKWSEISDTAINNWEPENSYSVNDLVIYNDKIYKCLEGHTSVEEFDSMKWLEIGNGATSIVFHKDIDVNDEPIKNGTNNNIVIQLKNNLITIDDSRSDEDNSYSKRVGSDPNALATVGYVDQAVNNTLNNDFSTDGIINKVGKEESAEITLYDFDESFGDTVYLKNVSVNVRQMFIPISEQVSAEDITKCAYLDWDNRIITSGNKKYEEGDCVYYNNNFYQCKADYTTGSTFDASKWDVLDYTPEYYELYTNQNFYNVAWYKSDVIKIERDISDDSSSVANYETKFYVCMENHIASYIDDDREICFENDLHNGCWKELVIDIHDVTRVVDVSDFEYIKDSENTNFLHLTDYFGTNLRVRLPEIREIIKTIPDIKYVGIKSIDKNGEEEDKWLFDVNDVDLRYRNTNGYAYPYWEESTTYEVGDIVTFNYSNYKCLFRHTTTSTSTEDDKRQLRIDLHNAVFWKKLNESGFNYTYHFEKDLLVKYGDDFEIEDYMYRHNFAYHTLKLCLYDENCELIQVLNYDSEKYMIEKLWQPNVSYYIGDYVKYNNKIYITQTTFVAGNTFETTRGTTVLLQEISKKSWVENTNYYKYQYIMNDETMYQVLDDYKSSTDINTDINNGKLKFVPYKYVQIGSSGDLIVDIEYIKR